MEEKSLPDDNKPPAARTLLSVVRELADSGPPGLKLELGGGVNPVDPTRFENVDLEKGADICADLFKERRGFLGLGRPTGYRWPFKDASVSFVYGSHFLEHVPEWDFFWAELGRVLVPKGRVIFTFPYGNSNRFHQDPTHKQALVEERFAYLNREWRELNGLSHYLADVNFLHEFVPWFDYASEFAHLGLDQKEYKRRHMINVVDNMTVFLVNNP